MKYATKHMKRGSYYQARRDYWNSWAPHSQARGHRYLTVKQHRAILKLVQEDRLTMAAVARRFGLGYSTVTKIVYGTHKPRFQTAA